MRPPVLEPRGLSRPRPYSSRRWARFVGDLPSPARPPIGIRMNRDAVAAIVEGVEQHGKGVVLSSCAVSRRISFATIRSGCAVPAARRDVKVRVVEEHPDVGPLRRRLCLRPAPAAGSRLPLASLRTPIRRASRRCEEGCPCEPGANGGRVRRRLWPPPPAGWAVPARWPPRPDVPGRAAPRQDQESELTAPATRRT